MENNVIRRAVTIVILGTVIFFGLANRTHAQNQCDAAIIEAMKTRFSTTRNATVQESVEEATCQQSRETNLDAFSLTLAQNTSQACTKKDTRFFSNNYEQIAFAILPPDAADMLKTLCGGGNQLSLKAVEGDGGVINVSANWIDTNGHASTAITDFKKSPNIDKCEGRLTQIGTRLTTGGLHAMCYRKTGDVSDAHFYIDTRNGFATDTAYLPHSYGIFGEYVDDVLKCDVDGNHVFEMSVQPSDWHKLVVLDDYIKTRGVHVIQCTATDLIQFGNPPHPNWSYKFSVVKDCELNSQTMPTLDKNGRKCETIASLGKECKAYGCSVQPPPIDPIRIFVK
jgi:hypothetical protein